MHKPDINTFKTKNAIYTLKGLKMQENKISNDNDPGEI